MYTIRKGYWSLIETLLIVFICFFTSVLFLKPFYSTIILEPNQYPSYRIYKCLTTLFIAPYTLFFLVSFVKLKNAGIDYFHFRVFKWRLLIKWVLVYFIVQIIFRLLSNMGWYSWEVIMEDFKYNYWPYDLLIVFVTIFLVPFYEEVFIRGFMFKGIEDSRLGKVGAIILTSLFFIFLHPLPKVVDLMIIGSISIILGVLRAQSQSIIPCILLHALHNFLN